MRFIVPNYLKNFKCDGAKCNSYCCREWKVAVDEETKNKYEKLPQENRERILLNIGEKENGFYPLKLNKDGFCPFLRDDFLCDLQKNFGEDYLSNICYSYPRVTTKINNNIFQSLTLSCPIAADLVLFAEEIFFEEKNAKDFRIGWHTDITARINMKDETIENIISAGLFILKDNTILTENKLKILLNFYALADNLTNDDEKLNNLLNSVENNKFQQKFLNTNSDIKTGNIFKEDRFLTIIFKLYNALYDIDFEKEKQEALTRIYRENFEDFNKKIIDTNNHIFTNFLVNEFFMRVYPFAFNESFAINVKVFILSWYALCFALFMMSMDSGLTEERLVFVVRRLVERMDHGRGVIKKIIDLAKEI